MKKMFMVKKGHSYIAYDDMKKDIIQWTSNTLYRLCLHKVIKSGTSIKKDRKFIITIKEIK